MGLRLHMLSVHISSSITTTGTLKSRDCNALCTSIYPCGSIKLKEPARRVLKVSSALVETAASIAVAATVVGAATTILLRRNKASETIEYLGNDITLRVFSDTDLEVSRKSALSDHGLLAFLSFKKKDERQAPLRICEDCGGSGVCAECRGEGFVLKKMSDENAERARLMAKNAATRYTAGLPKKWGYCMKCNAARSCSSCGGVGKLN